MPERNLDIPISFVYSNDLHFGFPLHFGLDRNCDICGKKNSNLFIVLFLFN